LLLLPLTVIAAPPTRMEISQVVGDGRDITLYVNVRDRDDQFVSGLDAAHFTATIGRHTATVTAAQPFADTGEGVLHVFLVDTSASLSRAQFGGIRDKLKHWIETLTPQDRAGLIRFGETVELLVEPTADQTQLINALTPLQATDRLTALHRALVDGISLARRHTPEWPSRRVLVTLTDGIDDHPGLASAREVDEAIAATPAPIYAVGFAGARVPAAERRRGLVALGEFARRSGGVLHNAALSGDPIAGLDALQQHIREVYRLQLHCADCELDGAQHPLHLILHTDEAAQIPADTGVRLLPPHRIEDADEPADADTVPTSEPVPDPSAPAEPDSVQTVWLWWLLGGLVALLLLVGLMLAKQKKKGQQSGSKGDIHHHESRGPDPVIDSSPWDQQEYDMTADLQWPDPTPEPTPALTPPPSATCQVEWIAIRGPHRGQRFVVTLQPTACLGRDPSCDLALVEDTEVSAQHAELLLLERGRVVVRDLGSTNGTALNGIPIHGVHPLTDGDVITLGQSECRLKFLTHAGN